MPSSPKTLPKYLAELPEARRRTELAHIIWQQMGLRVHPQIDGRDATELLWYNIPASALDECPTNPLRRELMAFIEDHKDLLSLPCDGNCFGHSDAKVLQCYMEYQRDMHVEVLDLSLSGGQL